MCYCFASRLALVEEIELTENKGMGFVSGGSDTTHATMSWTLKFMSRYQQVQSKLRQVLREAFPAATAEKREPTAAEITSTSIPYLDACVEELIRHARTECGTIRRSSRDMTILGRHVPKGTDIFVVGIGPSYFEPAFEIPDSLRNPTALASKSKFGAWDPKDMAEFKPERWLATNAEGQTSFNPSAGPHLTFGGGIRGCWGKRMGYMTVRIELVLILWKFELLEVPDELNDMSARDGLSHVPQQCYIRLRKVVP
jgi:cytochrome P450